MASFPLWKQQIAFQPSHVKQHSTCDCYIRKKLLSYIVTCRIIANSNLYSEIFGKWEKVVRTALNIKISKTATDGYTLWSIKRGSGTYVNKFSNLNRFSTFVHCWKSYEISHKTITTLSSSPQMFCRYSADIEKNANKLHFECTNFNSSSV